ncbi:amino acid permease-domain-containing protein, partial [Cladorrhinum sp. PSN259]
VNVEIYKGPLERLQSLDPATSRQLKANRNGTFSQSDWHKFLDLKGLIKRYSSQLFRGRTLPNFELFLADVSDEESDPPRQFGTCICIKGLLLDEEIKMFHTVLSQKQVRSRYAPLRLCYQRSQLYPSTKEAVEKATIIKRPPGDWTLSGAVVRTDSPDGTFEATVGGLIMVEDSYYLITGYHPPPDSSGSAMSRGQGDQQLSLSSFETLVDDDFDDDVEQALVLGENDKPEEQDKGKAHRSGGDSRPLPLDSPIVAVGEAGFNSHWRLLSAKESLRLPNLVISSTPREPPSPESPHTQGNYIQSGFRSPVSLSNVTINAGVSGVGAGSLPREPSFMMLNGAFHDVWSLQLQNGFTIQSGDSGSWVLDADLCVVGSIIAFSNDYAYMVSFVEQVREIERHFKLSGTVRIPSPFELLVDLAHYTFSVDRDMERALVFAHRALSDHSSSAWPSSDISAAQQALSDVFESSSRDERNRLATVLCKEGRDLDILKRDRALEYVDLLPAARDLASGNRQDITSSSASGTSKPPPRGVGGWSSRNPYEKYLSSKPDAGDEASQAEGSRSNARTSENRGQSFVPDCIPDWVTDIPSSGHPQHPHLPNNSRPPIDSPTRTMGDMSIAIAVDRVDNGSRNETVGISHAIFPLSNRTDFLRTFGSSRMAELLSRFAVVCLTLNRAIGSGIFIQPFNVWSQVQSSGIALAIWFVAGLVVLALMLCWIEMARSVPGRYGPFGFHRTISGGDRVYLQRLYSRHQLLITCVFGITHITFGSLGAEAIQFGVSMQTLIDPSCTEDGQCFSKYKVVGWGLGAVTLCALLSFQHRRVWIQVSNQFALFKVLFLVITAIMGIAYGSAHGNQCHVSFEAKGGNGTTAGDISLAVLLAMYAYSGFEQPFYALESIRHPQKFATSMITAMLILLVLFPLVNLGYMCAVPNFEGASDRNVATAIYRVFRPDSQVAERVTSALLAFFILGSILAQTFTSAGVISEIGREGILPFSKTLPVPIAATFLFWVFSILWVSLFGYLVAKPSLSYVYLTVIRTVSITGILGLLLTAGLAYDKVGVYLGKVSPKFLQRIRWQSVNIKTTWKTWLEPLPTFSAALTLAFVIIAAFIAPHETHEGAPLPYWVVPLVAYSGLLLGVTWWLALLFIQWYRRMDLIVVRKPVIVKSPHGTEQVVYELVQHTWEKRGMDAVGLRLRRENSRNDGMGEV